MAIRMKSVPSMKSEEYWVLSVFDLETKKFVCPPCSRCDCPAGFGCSHSRAQFAIISALQVLVAKGHEKSEIVAMFPEPIETMKGKPIPWEYAFQDSESEKELKRLKKIHNRVKANQRGFLERFAERIATDENGDQSDDSDSDWASDGDSLSTASYESEWDDDDEEEDDVWELNNIVDTSLEDDSKKDDGGEIKVCERVHEMLQQSALYARVSGNDAERTNEYKMETGKIDECLQDLLNGKNTPDESVEKKLYQLQLLQQMDDAFERREMSNCLLSFYLMHTRKQRAVMTTQLEWAKKVNDGKKDLLWTSERLSKLPPGYSSLADRGFSGCSADYPNMNGVRHPSFLDGRDQFTFDEVMLDRDDCQARYGSEAFFSRVTDLEFLQDRVPRHRFHHFQNCLYWAMGRANLNQPYYVPHGAEDYFPKCTDNQKSKRRRIQDDSLQTNNVSSDSGRSGDPITNFIQIAMPQEYIDLGLDDVGLLNDGKDFVTDTVRLNSCISRGQYSDKMKSSAARFIAWILPCGLSVTYTPLFLGRVSEKALVKYWGGSTYDFLCE